MAQDQTDFVEMLESIGTAGKHFAAYAREQFTSGRSRDPRDLIPAFQCAADNVRGWCVGRFGEQRAA